MTDIFFPADVPVAKVAPRLIDSTGRFTSPLNGAVRTVARPGSRWGLRVDFQNLYQRDRARLEAFIARMRGAENRALISPPDYQQRGSFPSGELFTNNNFANGTAGWTVGAGATMAVLDRRLRLTFNGAGVATLSQTPTLAVNTPYVARYFLVDGMGTPLALSAVYSAIEGSLSGIGATTVSVDGLNTVNLVLDSGTAQYVVYPVSGALIPAGQVAGNYLEVVWTSFSQCALVDNAPNLLLQSNAFGTSPWSASGCISGGVTSPAAPDGSITAQDIEENTASNVEHFVSQSVTTPGNGLDYSLSVSLCAGARSWAALRLYNSGGGDARAFFNLATGAKGSISVTGVMRNARSAIVSLGNGWYRCSITANKDASFTSLQGIIESSTGDGVFNYAGANGTVAIRLWQACLAQSGAPLRTAPTATSAAAAQPQTGSALNVKGLPPATAGLLFAGDWFEVNKELKRCTAQLDADASGLGYLQFSPPLRSSPNDNDPVIINMPMGRFVLGAAENGWETEVGFVSSSSLDFVEAP